MMNRLFLLILLTLFLFIRCHNNKIDTRQKDNEGDTIVLENQDQISDARLGKNFFKEIPFYKELLSKLNNEKDTMYICSRYTLLKINKSLLTDTLFKAEYKKEDKEYKVKIKLKKFNPNAHTLELVDTIFKNNGKVDKLKVKNIIDNHKSYGIDGTIPLKEVDYFNVKINSNLIEIPAQYFNNIYEINLNKTEVYLYDNETLFVYLNGSDAAGSYSAKFVINKSGYITRIVTEHCGFDFIDGIKYDCF